MTTRICERSPAQRASPHPGLVDHMSAHLLVGAATIVLTTVKGEWRGSARCWVGLFWPDVCSRGRGAIRHERDRHRASRPHRRQRLLVDRRGHRRRSAPLRHPSLPHIKRARVVLRQPLHGLQRLPPPRLRQLPGCRLPAAHQPGHHQPVLRSRLLAGGGARAH